MNLFAAPWLELAILLPPAGAVVAGFFRTDAARRSWGTGVAGAALACAVLAWLGHETASAAWEILPRTFGYRPFHLDGLNAPLLPLAAVLYFLTALATTGPAESRWAIPLLLAGEALQLAAFAAIDPWPLTVCLALGTLPPLVDLWLRGQPLRVFVAHAGLFVGLLVLGTALLGAGASPAAACLPLLVAAFVRSGTVPFHLWVPDLFERASFASAVVYATPLAGVYLAVRLVVPACPAWMLDLLGWMSLLTAVFASAVSIVQTDARRFVAYQVVSHAAMVAVGLQLNTPISLTGALCLWFSVALSLAGQGLILRALEVRFGRVAFPAYRGLYDQSPPLAVGFLVTGLGSVGFPGTLGFIAAEMLAGGAVGANPAVGVAMIAAAALNGVAVVRVYFLIFTGTRYATGIPLGITRRELAAVLALAALILGGGLYPQPGVASRQQAADETTRDRRERLRAVAAES